MTSTLISKVTHSDILSFAQNTVNLSQEHAAEYREQVKNLREKLEKYIEAHPDYSLIKMLNAGSVAKGTALSTINDMDVAVYVKMDKAPGRDSDLVPWLGERLKEAYPNLKADQFDTSQPHCVTISFKGSGLDVDVVPILRLKEHKDDYGILINKDTGDRTLTNIPLHLEFIRNRKSKNPEHYAQIVRLMKWWAKQRKDADPQNFKCKSFMLELIVAHLADAGLDLSDYAKALEKIFSFFVQTGLEQRIAFTDYYPSTRLPAKTSAAIEIFDPVNPENNIANRYSVANRNTLVAAAEEAADSISEALTATTKSRAVESWKRVFGSSFNP